MSSCSNYKYVQSNAWMYITQGSLPIEASKSFRRAHFFNPSLVHPSFFRVGLYGQQPKIPGFWFWMGNISALMSDHAIA